MHYDVAHAFSEYWTPTSKVHHFSIYPSFGDGADYDGVPHAFVSCFPEGTHEVTVQNDCMGTDEQVLTEGFETYLQAIKLGEAMVAARIIKLGEQDVIDRALRQGDYTWDDE